MRVMVFAIAVLGAVQAVAAQSVGSAGGVAMVEAADLHLRGLDTLNGTARDIDLRAGETVNYGHLEITAETCRVPRSDPTGDAVALLSIRDIREEAPRFTGWMFASSPALSALDHPRYDVWVESCSMR